MYVSMGPGEFLMCSTFAFLFALGLILLIVAARRKYGTFGTALGVVIIVLLVKCFLWCTTRNRN